MGFNSGFKGLTMFYIRNTPRRAIHAAWCGMAIVITKDPTMNRPTLPT